MNTENLLSIVKKIKALDNEVKLKIFMLIVEDGAKSITDVSKILNLNFSTAHKYLEEFEAAGILESKETIKNRLKRMFFVRDFHIELSPTGLAGLKTEEVDAEFRVITATGKKEVFVWDEFVQPYLEIGIQKTILDEAKKQIYRQAYDGITTLELRNMLRVFLRSRVSALIDSIEKLKKDFERRSYANSLALLYPSVLDYHTNGTIFIKNLGAPRYLSYMFDIRGLFIHGVNGSIAKNVDEFLDQVKFAIVAVKACAKYRAIFGMDSFNYFIAPLLEKEKNTKNALKKILDVLNSLDVRLYLGLELGEPDFMKTLSTEYFTEEKSKVFSNYHKLANKIAKEISELYQEYDYSDLRILFKCRTKKPEIDFSKIKKPFYIANLNPDWQTSNASYIGDHARFDCSWKQWLKTVRTGEVQKIALNLPRLAMKSKDTTDFMSNLDKTLDMLIKIYVEMVEKTLGEFLKYKDSMFESVKRERWSFAPIKDALYSISIVGLNEAVKILALKNSEKLEISEKILVFMNKKISESKFPIRIALREEKDPLIVKRFYSLDKKTYGDKLKVTEYSEGILGLSPEKEFNLHKYLLGGHSAVVKNTKINIKSFLNSEGGLIKVI